MATRQREERDEVVDARPTLTTERLILRPFTLADATDVQRLAGDAAIAATTLSVPHPYEKEMAEAWIDTHAEEHAAGTGYVFAITLRDGGALVGAIGLKREADHERAEIGYWIGRPYWRRGYASEAARAVLDFAFEMLGCQRLYGRCFAGNLPSRRVLEGLGLRYEGCQRQHVKKPGGFRDVELFGLLRADWRARRRGG
ncbi:MAG: N-acetyltransferase [Acidobacteria bacterium]|nr:MAG: N-acetyltransferase [Acidobacteriota bacterium]